MTSILIGDSSQSAHGLRSALRNGDGESSNDFWPAEFGVAGVEVEPWISGGATVVVGVEVGEDEEGITESMVVVPGVAVVVVVTSAAVVVVTTVVVVVDVVVVVVVMT